MNEHRTHAPSRPIGPRFGRGALVAIATLALAGTTAASTEASGSTPPRPVDQVSYRAFRGTADAVERWVEAAITDCIDDARPTNIPQTADAIDRQLSKSRETCTAQIVTPDRN